jgi:pimeloyl-ACP methyl ester carboxylesterase
MPLGGQPQQLEFNRDTLAAVLRILAYAPDSQALLPLMVYEAATEQHYERLAAMTLMILEGLNEAIYRGLEASVMCAEDVPQFPELPQYPETLMGDSLLRIARQQCKLWPHGSAAPDFHQPFASPVPVLLLSGQYDPVTPPAYGERALLQYASGLHLVAAGQGHSVSGRGCMPKVLEQFVSAGSVHNLELDCLDALGDAPFFTTLLGSEP